MNRIKEDTVRKTGKKKIKTKSNLNGILLNSSNTKSLASVLVFIKATVQEKRTK
jgi:hypothetical protein